MLTAPIGGVTLDWLSFHVGSRNVRVAITGSSGLVGSALRRALAARGATVTRIVRSMVTREEDVRWDPERSEIDGSHLCGLDVVVHLAGESLAEWPWTESRKRSIRDSRINSTRTISEAIARIEHRPRVLISASAVGYYGDRGDETLTEESEPGEGFLPELCKQWEAATSPAAESGVRVVHLRFGVILSPDGGALKKMLLPFRIGAGGRLGSGVQYMPWISIDDAISTILHATEDVRLAGPVNTVSPNPVTNIEFTNTLASVLGRPAIMPAPAAALRLAFGEMADAILLPSQRVEPSRLLDSGFRFKHPLLRDALVAVLNKS